MRIGNQVACWVVTRPVGAGVGHVSCNRADHDIAYRRNQIAVALDELGHGCISRDLRIIAHHQPISSHRRCNVTRDGVKGQVNIG